MTAIGATDLLLGREEPSGRLGEVAAWLLLLALSLFALVPGLLLGPIQDAGIFGTLGEQLVRGELPYRDAWDHKPPGAYLVAAAAALLPGPTWPAFWMASVVWLATTGVVLRRIVGLALAGIAVASMGFYPASVGGGLTETFAALPAAVAFLLACRSRWVAAGLAAGLALSFSLQAAPLLIALVVLAGARPRALAGGLLGVSVVIGSVVGVLALAGILPHAVDAVVTYNRFYLESDRTGDLRIAHYFAVVLLPLGAALPFVAGRRWDRAGAAAGAWIVASAILIALQGRLWAHYVIPLAIPLAVLARGALARPRAAVAVGLATVAMAGVSFLVAAQQAPVHGGRIGAQVGAWVQARTDPTDTILVWGVDAGIYLAAERAPTGRYPYDLPLVTHGYATTSMIATWVEGLDAAPPRVIVDAEAASGYWGEDADFLRPPPPGAAGGRDLDLLDPFRDWVRANYELVTEIEGRKIYEFVAE